MSRTFDGVEIHTTAIAQFTVSLFVTADGHAEAFSGRDGQEAHDKGYAWLQALPAVTEPTPALPVVAPASVPDGVAAL